MTHIRTFKKGAYKDYVANGLVGGVIVGLLFFFIKLIENKVSEAFRAGFVPTFICIVILFTLGFFYEEWFKRKQTIKKLLSYKYTSLSQLGYVLNNDLSYVSSYKGYFSRFHYFQKWVQTSKYHGQYQDSHSFDIYCVPKDRENLLRIIESVKQANGVQNAAWGYGIFSIWFVDNFTDFMSVIGLTTDLLEQNNFTSVPIEQWGKSFENELKTDIKNKEEERTVQIIKWGKINIKYQRPTK